VDTFRPDHSGRSGRIRGAAHVMLERALNPTRDQMLTLAVVSLASVLALIGFLAVLDASKTPSVFGRGAYKADVGDAPVPSVVTEPDAVGQNESDPTRTRSENEGQSSAISPVSPLIGEPVNFGGEDPALGANPAPFPDPQPAPSPSPSPAPSPNPSPTPTPTPSPTPEPSPSSEPSPEPSEEPEPSPEPSEEPEPSPEPSEEPEASPPPCVPPPHC
jgi:hypothetical protein